MNQPLFFDPAAIWARHEKAAADKRDLAARHLAANALVAALPPKSRHPVAEGPAGESARADLAQLEKLFASEGQRMDPLKRSELASLRLTYGEPAVVESTAPDVLLLRKLGELTSLAASLPESADKQIALERAAICRRELQALDGDGWNE